MFYLAPLMSVATAFFRPASAGAAPQTARTTALPGEQRGARGLGAWRLPPPLYSPLARRRPRRPMAVRQPGVERPAGP